MLEGKKGGGWGAWEGPSGKAPKQKNACQRTIKKIPITTEFCVYQMADVNITKLLYDSLRFDGER